MGGVFILNQNLPKYLAVSEWLKDNIKNQTLKPGEKLISENQLCEKFSISRQTVRQAISVLEKEGLVTRIQGSGTYINEVVQERKPTYHNIGLVTTYLDDYIFPTIISGVEKVLSRNKYNMTLRLTRNKVQNERVQLQSLLNCNVDGLIVEGTKTALPNPNLDVYQSFLDRGIPVIFINAYYHSLNCNYIVNDDIQGGRLATRYLTQNGHQKIAGIFKHDDLQGSLRYKGFIDEMYDQNLKVDEHCVIWYSTESKDDQFSLEQLPFLTKKLKGCSAVICYNDQLAMKLIQLFGTSNLKIPHDLSLVSFDDSSLSEISMVPLTTVTHPGKELGRLAAESILTMIKDPSYTIKHTYTPTLITRDSVRPFNSK